jgi:ABC-type uncharacterized transport system involved in gliding motility auxiliary subunit
MSRSLLHYLQHRLNTYIMRFTLIVLAILFIAINTVATNILGARQIDLTSNKLYTISDGTRRTLANLEDTVRIRFYYSSEQATGYPAVQAYATRIRSLLQHYEALSGGKVKVEVINPTPYTEVEDEAVKEGMQGIPIDEAGARIYLGMYAAGGTEKTANIPFFNPQRAAFLEYDLTKIIYDLSHPKKPVVTVISGLPMRLGMTNYLVQPDQDWAILTQMEGFFEMQYQEDGFNRIPENTDVLMVVHPDNLNENDLLLIDQYLMEGRKAIIFTDPMSRVEGVKSRKSELNKIIQAWGANMPENDIVGDRSAAVRLPSDKGSTLLDTIANLTWLEIRGWGFTRKEVISSDLSLVRFITAGHFERHTQSSTIPGAKKAESTLSWSPLITSSQDVTLLNTQKVNSTEDMGEFLEDFKAIGKAQVLAVKIEGKTHSAFPEKSKLKGFLSYSLEPSTLILVADTDILRNGLWVNQQRLYDKVLYVPIADNGAFVMNAVDYLAGSRDLIALRSRSDVAKTFERVDKLKRVAEVKFRAKEEALQARVKQMEIKLEELKTYSTMANASLPTSAQSKEISAFREQLIQIRTDLRDVRQNLHREISQLNAMVSFVNIALVPIIIIVIAMFVPLYRHRHERRSL